MGHGRKLARAGLWIASVVVAAPTVSGSAMLTAPRPDGRFGFDITPGWFGMAEGNPVGFGADDVAFSGARQGLVGYRMAVFDVLASLELGQCACGVVETHRGHRQRLRMSAMPRRLAVE